MIPALIPSPEPLVPVYCFQHFTTVKFCNSFALITIQNARGGGSPLFSGVKVLLELGPLFPSDPSKENPTQQRTGNSWFSRVTNHLQTFPQGLRRSHKQSRVALLCLLAPSHSHSIGIGNLFQDLFPFAGETYA
jgi:hypothetical protein